MALAGGIMLAEQEARQAIELFIDQQVFMDAVHGNEQVEELSAHTEVTTFEYRGDDLFLEGNILFTAYLDNQVKMNNASSTQTNDVENVQHRMPFDLKVPVAFQPKGLLDVQVQIPDATIRILGPGWTNVQAFLVVEGLSPTGGYVAHFGAQEAKEPPQYVASQGTSVAQSLPADKKMTSPFVAQVEEKVPEKEFSLSDWLKPFEITELSKPTSEKKEELIARSDKESQGQHIADLSDVDKSKEKWKMDLQGADRALSGEPSNSFDSDLVHKPAHPFKTGQSPELDSKSSKSDVFSFSDETRTDHQSSLHFHFENADVESAEEVRAENHSDSAKAVFSRSEGNVPETPEVVVTPPVLTPQELVPTPVESTSPPTAPVAPQDKGEIAFSLEAEVTAVDVGKQKISGIHAGLSVQGDSDGKSPLQMSYTAVPEEEVEMSAAEWFWKTMNIPAGDAKCTMKFRIVHDAETLEDISSLYHVSVADLMRVNDIALEGSIAGALLYIPDAAQ